MSIHIKLTVCDAYLCICSCQELPQEDFCSTVLSSTIYAPSTLWINPNDLDDEIRQLNKLPDSAPCRNFLTVFNCTIRYPACNANATKVAPICTTQCALVDLQKSQCALVLDKYPELQVVKELVNTFACKEPVTYYNFHRDYIETTNSSDCVMLSKS